MSNRTLHSHVHWSVTWKKPHVIEVENKAYDVAWDEAERRMCDIARTAVQHAVVSGESEIVIKIKKAHPSKGSWR